MWSAGHSPARRRGHIAQALIYKRARRPRDKSLRRATLFIRLRVFLKLPSWKWYLGMNIKRTPTPLYDTPTTPWHGCLTPWILYEVPVHSRLYIHSTWVYGYIPSETQVPKTLIHLYIYTFTPTTNLLRV